MAWLDTPEQITIHGWYTVDQRIRQHKLPDYCFLNRFSAVTYIGTIRFINQRSVLYNMT